MDVYLRSWLLFVRWLVEVAPSERAFLEGFFLDIYPARAHNDGTVAQIIDEMLAFPHKPGDRGPTALPRRLLAHDMGCLRPHFGLASANPGARMRAQ